MVALEELAAKISDLRQSYGRDMGVLRTELDAMHRTLTMVQSRGNNREDNDEVEMSAKAQDKMIGIKRKEHQGNMPKPWMANEADIPFCVLSHDLMTYVSAVSQDAFEMMEMAEKNVAEFNLSMVDEVAYPHRKMLDGFIYQTLSTIMQKDAKDMLRNSNWSGVHAWWQLNSNYNPRTTADGTASLERITRPIQAFFKRAIHKMRKIA